MTHAQGRRTDKIKVACRQTVGRENALWPWHWSSCRSRHGGRDSVFATSPSSLLATEINKALCWMRTAKLFFLAQALAKPALCFSEIFHLYSARGSQEFYVCYNWLRAIACSKYSFFWLVKCYACGYRTLNGTGDVRKLRDHQCHKWCCLQSCYDDRIKHSWMK